MLAPGYMTITIYLSIWRERKSGRGKMTGFHVPPAAFKLIVWTKMTLNFRFFSFHLLDVEL